MSATKDKSKPTADTRLRRRAEDRLGAKASDLHPLRSEKDAKRLVHELEVHQIELEMQNTELRRAREDLELSRNKYIELYDFAPVGYFTFDTKGLMLEVNLTGAKLLGIERKLLIKKPFSNFIATTAERDIYSKHCKDVFQKQDAPTCEIRLKRKDGSIFPAHLQSIARENIEGHAGNIHTTIMDVTEHKKAEEFLKQSETKYRLLADNIHDVIFAFDMNLNYTYISPSVKILRGYEPEEVLKLSLVDTLTPSSMDLAVKTLFDVMEMEKIKPAEITEFRTIPLEMRRKDGTTVWTEVKLSFIRDKDQQPVGILGVTRDITERKWAEGKLLMTVESLRKAVNTTIQVLVSALEARDPYTAGHQRRVADLARAIAVEMGLPQNEIDGIRMAGSIHDIGKLSIPAEILVKPTKLTNLEFLLIKEHSQSGYEMLKNVESPWPLAQIIYQHHERMDGSGYPGNLKGDEILMEARIMAVADVVEAMASHRPYRAALGIDAALKEIEQNKGIQYDKTVAAACLKLFREKGFQLEETTM